MKLYNTFTGKKEEFIPLKEGKAKIYVCGPTVYNYFHIGNARPLVIFDILRRYLIYKGYDVTYVQNFTDVDDKIIKKANEEGTGAMEIAERFIGEYFRDARGLGVLDADIHPRVSENMPEIIETVQALIEKGYAYRSGGDVYYRVRAFEDYGKLSKQSTKDLMAGARVDVNEEKESPLDFALWKEKKPGEIYWDSPFSQGRPGWHIECSVMSRKYLGDTIDIHGGGQDLIFPHHENEIAQSEAYCGCKFVNYWMHNGYLNVDDIKMSKSLGNFFTVREISEVFDLEVVRLFLLSVQYRSPINFSDEVMRQSRSALERLYNIKQNLEFLIPRPDAQAESGAEFAWGKTLEKYARSFEAAMDDDLNTAGALGVLFELGREINISVAERSSQTMVCASYEVFTKLAGVLGLLVKREERLLDAEVQRLIDERNEARAAKNFARADEIRDELKLKGIALEDTRDGVKWKREK